MISDQLIKKSRSSGAFGAAGGVVIFLNIFRIVFLLFDLSDRVVSIFFYNFLIDFCVFDHNCYFVFCSFSSVTIILMKYSIGKI